jgi:hypothetical protein
MDEIIHAIDYREIEARYEKESEERKRHVQKLLKGKQSVINVMFKEKFKNRGWDEEYPVFNDPDNDLKIDFWKRKVGVDVAFVHRSFIGGDLLRLQAGAEVKNVIKVGVYICPTRDFARIVSPKDGSSMTNYERTKWYLENFSAVLTVPILLIGLKG